MSQPIRPLIRFRKIDADVFKPWRRYRQSQHLTQIVFAYGTTLARDSCRTFASAAFDGIHQTLRLTWTKTIQQPRHLYGAPRLSNTDDGLIRAAIPKSML
jgi:hypothetical protein